MYALNDDKVPKIAFFGFTCPLIKTVYTNWLSFMTKQQHKNTFVEQTEAIWGKTSMQLLQKM